MDNSAGGSRFGIFFVNTVLLLLCVTWLIPTLGLFISSFRYRDDIQTTGWWTVFPHREYQTVATFEELPRDFDNDVPFAIPGVTETEALFSQWRDGVTTEEGLRVQWIGNKRIGRVEIQDQVWTVNWDFTLENYQQVLAGKDFVYTRADGTEVVVPGDDFVGAFLNSLAVAIPSTIIPILIAAFAAYGFAWMQFPGRRAFFIMVVALLVVPLQIALVPILRDYTPSSTVTLAGMLFQPGSPHWDLLFLAISHFRRGLFTAFIRSYRWR